MNPELPRPQQQSEQQPSGYEGNERLPGNERFAETGGEREQAASSVDRHIAPVPIPVPLPPPPSSLPGVNPLPSDDTVGPSIAADDDLIEKEWVDKAKKIITDTQNDPYRREQEINKLQIDYLRKRYGKELGASN